MSFTAWMIKVSAQMLSIADVLPNDIDDFDYRSAYDDEMAPRETAEAALEEAGWKP